MAYLRPKTDEPVLQFKVTALPVSPTGPIPAAGLANASLGSGPYIQTSIDNMEPHESPVYVIPQTDPRYGVKNLLPLGDIGVKPVGDKTFNGPSNALIQKSLGYDMFDDRLFKDAAYAPASWEGYNGKLVPTVKVGNFTFEDHTRQTVKEVYASRKTSVFGVTGGVRQFKKDLALAKINDYQSNYTRSMINKGYRNNGVFWEK